MLCVYNGMVMLSQNYGSFKFLQDLMETIIRAYSRPSLGATITPTI